MDRVIEAQELAAGDVVRDPEAHKHGLRRNVPGPSYWCRVTAITSAPDTDPIRFTYEYLDHEGKPTGRTDHAEYKAWSSLERF
jgi:hypothetical protein